MIALLAIGGAAGTVTRYVLSGWLTRGDFPWGTFAVNFMGSVCLAFFMFGGVLKGWFGPDTRLIVGIAFLGAFTTMSTFTYESLALVENGEFAKAGANFLINPVLCIGGAFAGRALAYAVPAATGGA